MNKLFLAMLSVILCGSVYAASLIECQGIDNPNTGLIKILTNKDNTLSTKFLVSYYDKGTRDIYLSNVRIDLKSKKIVDYQDVVNGVNTDQLVIEISDDCLTDGDTIRPYFYRSRVYFYMPGRGAVINTDYMKCRIFDMY